MIAVALSTRGTGWIPVVGSCLGAIAVFTLQGIPMRLLLLSSTALWLLNNVISRSYGGVVLESLIATASITTIARMLALRPSRSSAGSASARWTRRPSSASGSSSPASSR